MVEVDRKAYEEVIDKLLRTTDKRGIVEEFSKDVVLYCSILKDISKGKDSPNYHVLKKFTKNKWIVERAAVERAKSVFSYLSYKTLPDNHSGEHLSPLPVVINKSGWAGVVSTNFVYLPLLVFGVLGLFFYTSGKVSLINLINVFPANSENIQKFFSSGPQVEGIASNSSPLKGNESTVFAWEKTWKTPGYGGISKGELEENRYVVKKGDDLWNIAERFNVPVGDLKHTNNLGSNSLHVGDVLVIPNANRIGVQQSSYEVAGRASLGSFMQEKANIAENKEESGIMVASLKTKGTRLWGVNQQKTQREMTFAQESEGTEGQAQPTREREPERKPVGIEELLPATRKWTVDLSLSYSNIDREQQLGVVVLPGGPNIPLPVILGEPGDSDEDFLFYTTRLRYGLTKDLEVFAFGSVFFDFRRRISFTTVNGEVDVDRESDSEFNFGSAGIGATYQIRQEDKYPALLASASANIMENTDFGDDYELSFFKTFSASLVSFYTVDPVVFFLSTAYQQNLKRENSFSINPGEIFSVSPQVFFVVNPFITLSGGVRFSIRGGDKVNGDTVSSTQTSLSPLFGVSYGISDNLILSFDAEYRDEANNNQASAALRFTYTFE